MNFFLILEQALNGLQLGVMLFLMAAGLTLVFGIMNLVNLAHGSFYMVGAYLAAYFLQDDGVVAARAHHVERPVGEVHQVHDAEDEREARGHEEQHHAELEPVQRLLEDEKEIHRIMKQKRARCSAPRIPAATPAGYLIPHSLE